jgi:two-component system sensor histidine kinase KdpD
VVGATQPRMPPEVEDLVRGFEVISPVGALAIDVPAVLRRRPRVCLIDGLAYGNPPGGKHPQRWQDVEELLAAGISVITSINLQYVKERQNEVEAIRGKVVKDAVPEAFLRTADEIEVVDAPTLAPQFSALREIALLLTAEVVDHQLEEYLRRRGIEQIYGTHERILVCITPRSNAALMIRRGRRQADRFHGDLHVVYVQQDQLSPADRHMLEENLACAREANAHVEILEGEDPTASILEFAARQGITQIFVGHSLQTGWMSRWRINPVERFILEADGIDVRIFPHQDRRHE